MQLEKWDYPENAHVVFCQNKQHSFEPFMCLDHGNKGHQCTLCVSACVCQHWLSFRFSTFESPEVNLKILYKHCVCSVVKVTVILCVLLTVLKVEMCHLIVQ